MNRSLQAQQGVALVTALLVTAIAATAAASVAVRQQVETHRSGYMLQTAPLWQQLLAGEALARQVLARDARESTTDTVDETWSQEVTVPVEGGAVSGRIVELQGRFNLNSLGGEQPMESLAAARFTRLAKQLELPEGLTAALVDWIDADGNPLAGGAEDMTYLGGESPYRSANRPFVSPGELWLVAGIDADRHGVLEPLVSTLPADAGINLNTAPAMLLGSLFEGLEVHGDTLARERDSAPFESVDQFLERVTQLLDREENDLPDEGLSVTSDYFLLTAQAEYGEVRGQLYSLMQRDAEGGVRILRRSRESF